MSTGLVEAFSPVDVKPTRRSPSVLIRKLSVPSLDASSFDLVNRLPVEIIHTIVEHIHDRATLRALMLTNRTFYRCVFPYFYATLDFASYHSLKLMLDALEGPSGTLHELLGHWTTTLRLTNVGVSSTLRDAHLVALASATPQLRTLLLHWCHKISDDGIRGLLSVRPTLQTLRLDRCSRLTDATLDAIAELCGSNLRVLSISHVQSITDEGLLHIAQRCPNLRYLNVACCDKITDASLVTVMQRCHQLQSLNARLAMMTEPSIIELTKYTLPLQELNLVHLQNEYSLALLLQALHKQSNLTTLTLSLDNQITVEHITALLQQHPSLRQLHLMRCGAVEASALPSLNAANWHCTTKQNVLVTLDQETNMSESENDHLAFI